MRLAAVDIGSNAVRLLFCDVYPYKKDFVIKKTSLVRLPIRLGEDVFLNQSISKKNEKKLLNTIEAFKKLNDVYDVADYRVCATSAMRNAKNGKKIIQSIKKQTNIDIELLSGEDEAELIYQTHVAERINQNGTFLYMDVGGGSTETTIFSKGEKKVSKSFEIGTIRLKYDLVEDKTWDDFYSWIKEVKKDFKPSLIIATGGNINKLYKLCGLKDYSLFKKDDLNDMFKFLNKYSVENRIKKLGLKPDRADVITHAANIYLTAMKASSVDELFVPKVGLADGVIHELFAKQRRAK
jgi:exopolyphosphatase/guanosine-5'-triphosphate,3'-diphosphate pyrophosphatase